MAANSPEVVAMKHKKFAREFAKTGNGALSYSKVYPASTKAVSASSASRLLKNESVKAEIQTYAQAIAEKIGPKVIAKRLDSLCRAKKGIFHEGVRMDSEPDHAARNAAIRTVLQTQGALLEKTGAPIQAQKIEFTINMVKT